MRKNKSGVPITNPPHVLKPRGIVKTKEKEEQPLVSIITPVYKPNIEYLKIAYDSLLKQSFTNWEWCLCDDGSNDRDTVVFLNEIQTNDKVKIIFLEKNTGIANATNKALTLASGKFIAFMDDDDYLAPNALSEVMQIFAYDNIDIVYTDEVLISKDGNIVSTHAKPNYSPHYLLSTNYICHFVVVKKKAIDAIGGLRQGFDGSQDHDLILRLTNYSNKIFHLPKALYYWRLHDKSFSQTKSSLQIAINSGIAAVTNAFQRNGISAYVYNDKDITHYRAQIEIKDSPKVSIVVTTPPQSNYIFTFINKLIQSITYPNYEIIVVGKNITRVSEYYKKYTNIICISEPGSYFNFPRVLNIGIHASRGEYIVVMHDDVIMYQTNWLEMLIGYLQDKSVGIIGGKLHDVQNNIVDFGGVVGLNGIYSSMFQGMNKDTPGDFRRAILTQNTSIVPSSLMAFSRETYDKVNGFDEKFVLYNFDADFSLRVKDTKLFNVMHADCIGQHLVSKTRDATYSNVDKKEIRKNDDYLFVTKHKYIIQVGDPYYPSISKKTTQAVIKDILNIPDESNKEIQLSKKPQRARNNQQSTNIISFIVPWYNNIPIAITSLLVQVYNNIEIIVMHDGPSPPNVKEYIASLKDDRIKFYQTEKRYNDWGHTPRDQGIDKLSPNSRFTVFTGVDNYYIPSFTEEMIQPFLNNPAAVATYCDMLHNNRDWNLIDTRLEYSQIDCGCFMVQTNIAKEIRWGNKVSWEDWVFIEKVIARYRKNRIIKVPKLLYIHN